MCPLPAHLHSLSCNFQAVSKIYVRYRLSCLISSVNHLFEYEFLHLLKVGEHVFTRRVRIPITDGLEDGAMAVVVRESFVLRIETPCG